jgi:hypothetical protein
VFGMPAEIMVEAFAKMEKDAWRMVFLLAALRAIALVLIFVHHRLKRPQNF